MEDVPFKNPRSSAGSLNRSQDTPIKNRHVINSPDGNLQDFSEVFEDKSLDRRERPRTPSGNIITNVRITPRC